MPLVVRNVLLNVGDSEEMIPALAARRLRVPAGAIRHWSIARRSIDARKKEIRFNYQVEIALDEPAAQEARRVRRLRDAHVAVLKSDDTPKSVPGTRPLAHRPVVVGFGPAGMFAALTLAEAGYCPLVLERGREVRQRHRDIMQRYYRDRDFDPTSNLLFGEGGAGTYSDGKLYTRVHDPLCRRVLEVLYRHGADPDILINARPHVGSDKLPTICTRIRGHIESLGGEIVFERQVDDVEIAGGRLVQLHVAPSVPDAGVSEWVPAGPVILAVGHSARDTLRILSARGLRIDAKPFQIGVRIEHPQALVDQWQYGAMAGNPLLGAAEYHCVARGAAGEAGDLFSFCMCPGGVILPTNEAPGLVVTNGASRSQRSSPFANSGLVITVDPSTMGLDAMGALEWQAQWERMAYLATGETYSVPCQRASDFLRRAASDGMLETSFPLGGTWCDVRGVVPDSVAAALERGLPMLERSFPGFAGGDAILTAPETRASAPIRIVRDRESREALGAAGLYPVGEGAGYAGGIVSAAVDGLKSAELILRQYARP